MVPAGTSTLDMVMVVHDLAASLASAAPVGPEKVQLVSRLLAIPTFGAEAATEAKKAAIKQAKDEERIM